MPGECQGVGDRKPKPWASKHQGPSREQEAESTKKCSAFLIETAFEFFTQANIAEKDLHPGPLLAHVVPWKKVPPLGGQLKTMPLVVSPYSGSWI